MIKAIIFDFGGVLTYQSGFWPFVEKYSKDFNTTPEEFHRVIQEYWKLGRTDNISSADFWEGVSKELGCDKDYFRTTSMDFQTISEKMFRFVKSLKKKYKLAILSNHIRDWFEEIIEKNNFREIFDTIVTSYNAGVEKPNMQIYREIINKLGVKPDECVFIDDKEENLPPAKELGMKAILFHDINQLKEELKMYGVEIE